MLGSGSDFQRLLQILCEWWKCSENAQNFWTPELYHITGPFLASWAPVLAQHYRLINVLITFCAATATCNTRHTAHRSTVCQGVVFSLSCGFGFSVSKKTSPFAAWLLSCPSWSPGCTLYKHLQGVFLTTVSHWPSQSDSGVKHPVTLKKYFSIYRFY